MDFSKILAPETAALQQHRTQDVQPIIPKNFNGIMVVGDVPYDSSSGLPFSNSPYGTLCGLSKKAGFDFEFGCIQTTVLPYCPSRRIIKGEDRPAVIAGIERIKTLCETHNVKIILILGRQTLKAIKGPGADIDGQRGFPFVWNKTVCLASYSPMELYMKWKFYNVVVNDMAKAVKYSIHGWEEPKYQINFQPTYSECVQFLRRCINERPYLAMDLETDIMPNGRGIITCCGFGINKTTAFVIPMIKAGNKPYFDIGQEMVVLRLMAEVLETCSFVGQNACHYDHWFLAYWYGILLNLVDDTMIGCWEVYTELLKSMAFQSSIYTDNTYHKDILKDARRGTIPRIEEFRYNGLDNVITLQCAKGIANDLKDLPPAVKTHYRFKCASSRVFQYMSLRGSRIDRDLLKDRIDYLEIEAEVTQSRLISESGKPKLNVRSPKQMKDWLYKDLRLPKKFKLHRDKETGETEDRETADFLTLAYLARSYTNAKGLMTAATLRTQLKRISSLKAIHTGPNGECYWNFNCVGTDTARASGYKPMNGMGVQPQNVDRRDRDLFYPPMEGQLWGKCDLEGADSWSVAAILKILGDPQMLKDLQAGLKPAMILAIARLDADITVMSSAEDILKVLPHYKTRLKGADKQVYSSAKAVSHGTNYMMQAGTMHATIFRQSKAELYVPVAECEKLRMMYIRRYPGLLKFYEVVPSKVNMDGYLDSPSGHRRAFMGRQDNTRARAALAQIPQGNTAWATDRMLLNIFTQPYNRRADGKSLIMEPINQVHDEGDLAFFPDEIGKCAKIFQQASDLQSEVWGVEFKIPFGPEYGTNWGNCEGDLMEHL